MTKVKPMRNHLSRVTSFIYKTSKNKKHYLIDIKMNRNADHYFLK